VVVGDTWVEFADDFRFDEFPGDLFEDNESIRDRDDTAEWGSLPMSKG
jgi:hypothetical protein